MCLTTVMPFNSSQRYNLTKRDLSPGFMYYLGADIRENYKVSGLANSHCSADTMNIVRKHLSEYKVV